jgi:hypothetical protein
VAPNRLPALLIALCALSCTELSARWNDHPVFFGSVREAGTGAMLTTFCATTSVERSEVIVFSAPAGSMIQEEVFVEGRTEKYWGGTPPDRPEAFWCSDAPQVYLGPATPWVCLRAADDDPPATILAVEPRGEIGDNGSSGYALALQVERPGVLRVVLDEQCLRDRFDFAPDAAAPIARGELTIQ